MEIIKELCRHGVCDGDWPAGLRGGGRCDGQVQGMEDNLYRSHLCQNEQGLLYRRTRICPHAGHHRPPMRTLLDTHPCVCVPLCSLHPWMDPSFRRCNPQLITLMHPAYTLPTPAPTPSQIEVYTHLPQRLPLHLPHPPTHSPTHTPPPTPPPQHPPPPQPSTPQVILASEASKQQAINHATGEAEAIQRKAAATAEGLTAVAGALTRDGGSGTAAAQLRVAEQYVEVRGAGRVVGGGGLVRTSV
jgi:hypothetical protein